MTKLVIPLRPSQQVIFCKYFLCNNVLKTKALSKDFGCGMKGEHVAPHAEGPGIFPLVSEDHGASATKKAAKSRAVTIRADL
jgi:hypothetical protein